MTRVTRTIAFTVVTDLSSAMMRAKAAATPAPRKGAKAQQTYLSRERS